MSDVLASPRFLVMGCGAIGGVLTAGLAETGQDVTVVTTNASIHAAVSERGLKVVGEGAPRYVRAKVSLGVPEEEEFDFVLLATQPPQVEHAAREALPALSERRDGLLPERALRGAHRAGSPARSRVGAVVGWGATMPEPASTSDVRRGLRAGPSRRHPFGADPTSSCTSSRPLVRSRRAQPPGARWWKLAINCAISSLGTVGGERLGALMRHRFVRRLGLEIMTEVVRGRAQGGRAPREGLGHPQLSWIALTEAEKRGGRLAWPACEAWAPARGRLPLRRLRARCSRHRARAHARGRFSGRRGRRARREHGLRVPVNAALYDTVWAISKGKKKPGMEPHSRGLRSDQPHST